MENIYSYFEGKYDIYDDDISAARDNARLIIRGHRPSRGTMLSTHEKEEVAAERANTSSSFKAPHSGMYYPPTNDLQGLRNRAIDRDSTQVGKVTRAKQWIGSKWSKVKSGAGNGLIKVGQKLKKESTMEMYLDMLDESIN